MGTLSFEPLIPLALWLTLAGAGLALLGWYARTRPAAVPRRRWLLILGLWALGLVLLLLIVPYIDRKIAGVGRWFARERLLANSLFLTFVVVNVVLIIIGTFFRGPNWEFVSP